MKYWSTILFAALWPWGVTALVPMIHQRFGFPDAYLEKRRSRRKGDS